MIQKDKSGSPTILITSAINPPQGVPYLKMSDFSSRYLSTKASIYFWGVSGIKRIVVVDATAKNLLISSDLDHLNNIGVEIEQLNFSQNASLVQLRGKGYAEGCIIEYALKNSTFLNQTESFFKCTGKIYCRNFDIILKNIVSNNAKLAFWRNIQKSFYPNPWADTQFFFTSREFCENKLLPIYFNATDQVGPVEADICKLLNQTVPQSISQRPLLVGFSGYTGREIAEPSFGQLDMYSPCWIG
ncbi:hypothetical protein MCESTEHM2_00879 [Candidatus Methylopumilus universalis]|uniref:hypothetical protein n=1 Tax=Candidatus Methylopumilus universalis TaxID=2588536 RepID=UPI003BEF3591